MGFEPWRPGRSSWHSPKGADDLKPADEDVIRTLAEIEKASTPLPSATCDTPLQASMSAPSVRPVFQGTANVQMRGLAIALGAALGFVILGLNFLGRQASTGKSLRGPRVTTRSALNPVVQAEAEQMLQRVAAGESGAADQVLAHSADWTGKTQRSTKSEQWIGVILNLPDLHAREAGLQAEMALDGVSADESGFKYAEQAVSNPSSRVWALWMLGALGNRGVNAEHAAKIIGAYLSDPQVDVRAAAVNGLSLVGTDETIPPMLDRFRNDPSLVVQERAACALAELGMYRHEQRMAAAASFVGWIDDSLLSAPQREWALHALRDISGQNLGNDPGAWREWYAGAR